MGGSLVREEDVGGDEVRTVREGSFVLGGYTRNDKTNRKREFTGPRFTSSIQHHITTITASSTHTRKANERCHSTLAVGDLEEDVRVYVPS